MFDMRYLTKLRHEEVAMGSPPCQPFSSMGRGQGLDAGPAQAWDQLFKVARVSQRRMILLENVVALTKHSDLQEIRQAMRWAGYELIHKRAYDATHLGCAARPRLIMIFWNSAEWHHHMMLKATLPPEMTCPGRPMTCKEVGSVWEDMLLDLCQDLVLDDCELRRVTDPRWLPKWQRMQVADALTVRLVRDDEPMPSVTASYHKSTGWPDRFVEDKGLHVPLVQSVLGPRRLSKWEILHSMGMSMDYVLPASEADAITLWGESFCPVHAFQALLLALASRPKDPWSQDMVDARFRAGVGFLTPGQLNWKDLEQIQCEGWAQLVCASQAEAAMSVLVENVERAKKHFVGKHQLDDLGRSKLLQACVIHAFEEESTSCDASAHVLVKILRPHHVDKWTLLPVPIAESDRESVLQHIAGVLGTDPAVTLFQEPSAHPRWERTLLADEVVGEHVSKRLILIDCMLPVARWLPARVEGEDFVGLTGQRVVDMGFRVNNGAPVHHAYLEDGDVVALAMLCDVPLSLRDHEVMYEHAEVAQTCLDQDRTDVPESQHKEDRAQHVLPPPQPFEVLFPDFSCMETGPVEHRMNDSVTVGRTRWPDGGLKGGCPSSRSCALPEGWWVVCTNGVKTKLDLWNVGGRTLRQERESLGLMQVDTSNSKIVVVTQDSWMQCTWHYKFPYTATDSAVVWILHNNPEHIPWHELHNCLRGPAVHVHECLDLQGPQASSKGPEASSRKGGPSEAEACSFPNPRVSPRPSLCVVCDPNPFLAKPTRVNEILFVSFLTGTRAVTRVKYQTVAQILDAEWGIDSCHCVVTVNGKILSPNTQVSAIPVGTTIRISARLRGGVPQSHKKLKELLLAKGVPQDLLNERVTEVVSAIGDSELQEAFSGFDNWQALKAKCQGKVRLIKQTESRSTKGKKSNEDIDPLQLSDPWSQAIQARTLKPDPSFFQTADGKPPAILSSVSHGASGLVVLDRNEAQLLAGSQSALSPDALAVLVIGEVDFPEAKRPVRQAEFPCHDLNGTRLLAKGLLLDLGSTPMKVTGEDTIHNMEVVASSNLAVEIHKAEVESWDEVCKGPAKFLKTVLSMEHDAILHTWARRTFSKSKQINAIDAADTVFFMIRVKQDAVESALRKVIPGVYVSPRLESGQADPASRVLWFGSVVPGEVCA